MLLLTIQRQQKQKICLDLVSSGIVNLSNRFSFYFYIIIFLSVRENVIVGFVVMTSVYTTHRRVVWKYYIAEQIIETELVFSS